MGVSKRARNLVTAAGAVIAVPFAAYDLYQWVAAYLSDNFHNDLTFYYAAALIGLNHGWQSIYDLQLQQAQLDAMGSRIHVAELARYISPPPVAWLALPFTLLPFQVAYWTWSALLLAALVGAWHLAAPGSGATKAVHLAAALAWLPIIYGLQLGQPGLFVALGVAASYALLRTGRPAWAGAALGVLVLKPQLAFLVPAALLVTGRYRAFLASVAAVGVFAVASAINVGPGGIDAYLQRLNFAAGVPVNRALTLAPYLGSLTVTRGAEVVIALWALALAYRLRSRGPEWVFIPALCGGLLASPYLHLDDLVMLGLAGWVYLRTPAPGWTWALLFAIAVAAEGIPVWGPLPLIAGELAALVLMSLASPLKASDSDALQGRPQPVVDRVRQT